MLSAEIATREEQENGMYQHGKGQRIEVVDQDDVNEDGNQHHGANDVGSFGAEQKRSGYLAECNANRVWIRVTKICPRERIAGEVIEGFIEHS